MFVGLSLRDYIDPARDKGEALEVAARNIRESDSGREQFVAIFFVGLYYSFERTGRLKWSKTFSLAGLRKFERLQVILPFAYNPGGRLISMRALYCRPLLTCSGAVKVTGMALARPKATRTLS